MSKQITRTIKSWRVEIVSTEKEKAGEIISSEVVFIKPRLDKIASKRIKETGKMDFTISIVELEQQRAISFEDFMKYSKVIENNEQ